MKKNSTTPKAVLEVREWKKKISDEIRRDGFEKFHAKSEIIGKAFRETVEAKRKTARSK